MAPGSVLASRGLLVVAATGMKDSEQGDFAGRDDGLWPIIFQGHPLNRWKKKGNITKPGVFRYPKEGFLIVLGALGSCQERGLAEGVVSYSESRWTSMGF